MDVRRWKELIDGIETLMREELHSYNQLHALALKRSRAIAEAEYSCLATIDPESERLLGRIAGLERKLEPLRLTWLEAAELRNGAGIDVIRGLVRNLHQTMGEILAVEQESLTALSVEHWNIKKYLMELAEREKLTSYEHRPYVPCRLVDVST